MSSDQEPSTPDRAAIQQKVEIRFEKGEAVRFISHHDMMRAFQRALRRADLPVRLTEGFNPRPRIVFPVALEVGIRSLDEAAEIELSEWIHPIEVKDRLARTMPPGFLLQSARELPPLRQSQHPVRITYRLHLAEAAVTLDPAALQALMDSPALPFKRLREGRVKTVDLRPFLESAAADVAGDLEVVVKPVSQGLARPLELLSLALNKPLEELRHIRVTKTKMELAYPPEPEKKTTATKTSPKDMKLETEEPEAAPPELE